MEMACICSAVSIKARSGLKPLADCILNSQLLPNSSSSLMSFIQLCSGLHKEQHFVKFGMHMAKVSVKWSAQVIMRVPMEYCLVVNYEGGGVSLPNFAWPRLRKAVQENPELPWDLLLVSGLPNPWRWRVFMSIAELQSYFCNWLQQPHMSCLHGQCADCVELYNSYSN